MRQSPRAFVESLDFRSSVGFGDGAGDRERMGMPGAGPTVVITDLGVLRPDPESKELTLTQVHPGVTAEQARDATGWELKVADDLAVTAEPAERELRVLRELRSALEQAA